MARNGEVMSEATKARIADAQRRRQQTRLGGPDPPRRCRGCNRERPGRMFRCAGVLRSGLVHRVGLCAVCRDRRGKRPPKVNAAGDVWCSNCRRYLTLTLFRWMNPPSFKRPRWASSCIPCSRDLDRLRWRGDRRDRNNERRIVNQRKQAKRDQAARLTFVRDAIHTLRCRGFTVAQIATLSGISVSSLWLLQSKGRRPDPPTSERLGILLIETGHLPTGNVPAFRRRRPLPGFAGLVARVRPLMDAYPVRSRWKGRAS